MRRKDKKRESGKKRGGEFQKTNAKERNLVEREGNRES